MQIRLIPYLLLLAVTAVCSCKTAAFQKYFTPDKNAPHPYLCVVDSTNTQYMDTLICRIVIAKRERQYRKTDLQLQDTTHTNMGMVNNSRLQIFYYEKPGQDTTSEYMEDSSFAQRVYCFFRRNLYVGHGWQRKREDWVDLDLSAKPERQARYGSSNTPA